jgi:DNA-binding NarL/FixJ family response regulator
MTILKTTSVVLADDHESVRKGIRELLKNAPDIEVIGEASNGFDALKRVEEMQPDVILLDIEMPGMNGIEVTRRLRGMGAGVSILILSAYDDQDYIREVLENGASGYIVKGEAPRWVVEAVRGVARGEKGWVSERASQKIKEMNEANASPPTMTYRELETLRLMAKGLSSDEIAARTRQPIEKVEENIQRVMNKLDVDSPGEAIRIGKREGWV